MSGYLHFYAKNAALNNVADALNRAGNGFHNTIDWTDNEDYFGGKSACDMVQEEFDKCSARIEALEECLLGLCDSCDKESKWRTWPKDKLAAWNKARALLEEK